MPQEGLLACGMATGRISFSFLFSFCFLFCKITGYRPIGTQASIWSVYLNLPGWMILCYWNRFTSDQTTCLNSFVFTPAALWLCCSLSCSSGSYLTCSQIPILLPARLFPLVFWLAHFWHFQRGLRGRSDSLRLGLKSPHLELQRRGDMQDTYVIM